MPISIRHLTLSKRKILCCCAATLMIPGSFSAKAEEEKTVVALEEIMVTARKRAESMQDVPISISAFNAGTLDRKGVGSLRDLEFSIPNLTFTDQGNAFGGFGMRGIYTLVRSIGVESGVGVYVDGVYQGRNSNSNIDMVGIEQVEVLKGPQGTLFGRNTISGAINIVTKQPTEEFEATIKGAYGNYDRFNTNLRVSGPLVDGKLFASVSASHYERKGYTLNLFNGEFLDNADRQSGRFQLRFLPSDQWEINLSLDGFKDRGDTPRGGYLISANGKKGGFAVEFAETSDPRVTSLDNKGYGIFEERDIWGSSLRVAHDLNNGFTLTSITAYREGSFAAASDFDGTSEHIAGGLTGSSSNQFTQEIQLISPDAYKIGSLPGEFDFVLGAYYLYQDTTAFLIATLGDGTNAATDGAVFGGAVADGGFSFGPESAIKTKSLSGYVNANWHVSEKFTVTAGLRVTSEDKDLDFMQLPGVPLGIPEILPTKLKSSNSAVSPTMSLAYHIRPDVTVYSTISRGFKSAGFNADVVGNTDIEFDAEEVTNYEVGFKTMLLDQRLKFNGAFFYQDYTNLQVQQFIGAAQQVTNAAQATIYGLELELHAKPSQFVDINVGVGYIDAKFSSFPNATKTGDDFSGNKLTGAPKITANAALQYLGPISDDMELLVRGEAVYRGEQFFQPSNAAFTKQEGYALLNARAGLIFQDGKYEVMIFGKNLTNKVYNTNKLSFNPLGQELGFFGAPRTYGIELSVNF